MLSLSDIGERTIISIFINNILKLIQSQKLKTFIRQWKFSSKSEHLIPLTFVPFALSKNIHHSRNKWSFTFALPQSLILLLQTLNITLLGYHIWTLIALGIFLLYLPHSILQLSMYIFTLQLKWKFLRTQILSPWYHALLISYMFSEYLLGGWYLLSEWMRI